MSYLNRFWNNIKNSFYNPGFYAHLQHKRFSRAILVLLGVSMLSMLVICITIIATVGPFLKSFSSGDLVNTYYPEGLVLTVKDNKFTSNVDEPYYIEMPDGDKHGPDSFLHAVVIDTSDDLTLEQADKYDAFVVITKNGIMAKEDTGEMRAITLKQVELGDFVVNEENVASWIALGFGYLKMAAIPLLLLLFVFGTVFITMWQMFVLIFAALVVMIIAAIKNKEMSYPTAYIVALFASIPVIILNILLNGFTDIPPLVDLLLFIILVNINLKVTQAAVGIVPPTTEPIPVVKENN